MRTQKADKKHVILLIDDMLTWSKLRYLYNMQQQKGK